MRCVAWCTVVLIAGVSSTALAQVQTFPYEAVIATENAPVHSGPGYYATARLKKGDRVRVHRHDPGGWFMIEPPAGEFSLVAADAVRTTDTGVVEIIADETFARVGSQLTDDYNVEQMPLVRGERLQLAKSATAPEGWVAIVPPRGEFRWISGKFLVPAREDVRAAHDADPFTVPSTARRPATVEHESSAASPPEADARPRRPAPLVSRAESASEKPAEDDAATALRILDRELEGLTLTEPTDWPLEELAAEYDRLKSTHAVTPRQIDVRLAQLERMRMVRDHYSDYVQLTSSTDERDAALVAQYTGAGDGRIVQASKPVPPRSPVTLAPPISEGPAKVAIQQRIPSAPPAEPRPVNGNLASDAARAMTPPSQLPMAPPSNMSSRPSGPVLLAPETAAIPPASSEAASSQSGPSTGSPRRFDAVGVIQKAVDPHPDAPQHVLIAPSGEILVYLQSQPGISLDQFVGQSMGVDGERLRHPQLTPPMIVVERLTPVRF